MRSPAAIKSMTGQEFVSYLVETCKPK